MPRRRALPMLALLVSVLLAGQCLVTGTSAAGTSATGTSTACTGTMIFEVGPTGDPSGSAYDAVNAALPADVAARRIHYPAELAPLPQPGTTRPARHTLDESAAIGEARLRRAVLAYHAACPLAQLLVTGLSQGALVGGNVLGEFSRGRAIPHDRLSGVLYADPRRAAAHGVPGGLMDNLPTFMAGLTMQGARGFGDLAVRQVCHRNDGVCTSANPLRNLPEFANSLLGFATGAHNGYVLDPLADRGDGDLIIAQRPIVPYGQSLPLPVPTPRRLFEGRLPATEVAVLVRVFADLVYGVLNPAQRAALRPYRALLAPAGRDAEVHAVLERMVAAQEHPGRAVGSIERARAALRDLAAG